MADVRLRIPGTPSVKGKIELKLSSNNAQVVHGIEVLLRAFQVQHVDLALAKEVIHRICITMHPAAMGPIQKRAMPPFPQKTVIFSSGYIVQTKLI